jgi:hypothetical protein
MIFVPRRCGLVMERVLLSDRSGTVRLKAVEAVAEALVRFAGAGIVFLLY